VAIYYRQPPPRLPTKRKGSKPSFLFLAIKSLCHHLGCQQKGTKANFVNPCGSEPSVSFLSVAINPAIFLGVEIEKMTATSFLPLEVSFTQSNLIFTPLWQFNCFTYIRRLQMKSTLIGI
jgi:hypothetical protein